MRPRGTGRVFRRGKICWIAYPRNGHEIRESAETKDEAKAIKLLNRRVEEAKKPTFVGPSEKRLTLDDLEAAIKADYVRHQRKSWNSVENCLKPVRAYFKYDTLLEIGARIEDYQDHRLSQGMAWATINLECAYLRRGFKLLFEAKSRKISEVPVIKLLDGANVREGFLNLADFEEAVLNIKDEDTRDIVRFLYNSAWRSDEAKT